MRLCKQCGQPKRVRDFRPTPGRGDGYRLECRACENANEKARQAKRREADKARREASRAKFRATESSRYALIGKQAIVALFPEFHLATETLDMHDRHCTGQAVVFAPFDHGETIWHICHVCAQLWPLNITTGNYEALRQRADKLMCDGTNQTDAV
jgi:hypothetical protein